MKKALIAFAMLAIAGLAMAHGPPSALDSGVVAQASVSPKAGINVALNGGGSVCVTSHGGGSGWITPLAGIARMAPSPGNGMPPNERMLN